ncbi:2-OG-Fe(II) oxygenase superfamily protein [Schizosaccharomyces octosporus yFS286]|uniref:2-OG-Fe(II) oxygenase superfamily protein n=1 Tax=Schizosaccharomyces octosporus (strain yFS286) TaxID=483514 RepID=S9RIC5_SCHOY|nr:2-OG-Fe(II) oxygenase superfamily protein [Schizosaccharomyces octosporus yFS286]EPX73764.1 2-OG-Fe(II) oxygenase superfamily protein [Schizosaccharomyces octosporus yFS286]
MLSQLIQSTADSIRTATPQEEERLCPVIDFGPFIANEPGAHEKIVKELRNACESTGFFQIVNHSVSKDVIKNAFRASKHFFELPFDEKLMLSKDMFSNRGYELLQDFVLEGEEDSSLDGVPIDDDLSFPRSSSFTPSSLGCPIPSAQSLSTYAEPPNSSPIPWNTGLVDDATPTENNNAAIHDSACMSNEFRESFYFGNDNLSKERLLRPFQGPNKWPLNTGAGFRTALVQYHNDMAVFANQVMCLLAESLGLSADAFDEFCSDPTTAIRLLRYPSSFNRTGVNDHTDADALTLMAQDEVRGLQILDPVTQSFVAISARPDALVANLGDIMAILTNNRYKSSVHRVCNTSGHDRYTIPFFLHGNIDYVVAPLPGLGPSTTEPIAVEDLLRDHFQNSYTSHTTTTSLVC